MLKGLIDKLYCKKKNWLLDIFLGGGAKVKMGVPSFAGLHNQRKAQALFVFYRYSLYSPSGHGLMSGELAEILNLPIEKVWGACIRLSRWKYITAKLTPRGRKQCIYKISAKGSQWLTRWSPIIPWERYGWTAGTIADMDRIIKETIDFRGYD